MPATVFMVEIRDGFDVSTRSNIFPESSWVGSFPILTSPNSPTTGSVRGLEILENLEFHQLKIKALKSLNSGMQP